MPDITKYGRAIIHPPSKTEIVRTLKITKSGKAAGPDGIPPEALKINPKTLRSWEPEKAPSQWKNLVKLPEKGDLFAAQPCLFASLS